MTRKHIISSLFGAMASMMALTLTGCAEEDFRFDEPDTNGRGVTLSFSCNDMLPQYIDPVASRSRAADPKTEEEKKINSLHLFFFDSTTGDFVQPKLDDQMFLPYQYIPDATNLVTVGDEVFDNMTNVTVVAIANINATEGVNPRFCTKWTPQGDIRKDSRKAEGERWEIKNYSDLKQWIYHPRLRMDENRSVVDLPSAGMPMIGTLEGASLVQSATNPRLEVQLKALMARVNITIKLNPNQESRDGALPTMTITSYGIKNMPNTVPFTMPDATPRTGNNKEYNLTTGEMTTDFLYELPAPVTINKNSDAVTFSYYTYENIQLPDYTATRPGVDGTDANFFPNYNGGEVDNSSIRYPDGIDEADRQRWKPLMARKDASAMVLNASYVTHQNLRYQARFTIYMGQNPDNDFQVKRNHAYNNNISIRGLDYVRNSSDGVYTFDARVNVISDNPIYFAIVNERKIDAHATALPMDVWFLLREDSEQGGDAVQDWESTVELEIKNPDGAVPDWIRMEKIPRATMKNNGWKAGTGVRPYFTEDLVTNTLKDNTKITIDGNTDKSRTRVYFYIDENVPESNNPTNYGDRYATINVTYTRKDKAGNIQDIRTRTIEIDQRALVKVDGIHSESKEHITAWMEYYEEYLEHSDPLDQHIEDEALYDGLPWGENLIDESVRRVITTIDGCDVYLTEDAFRYTQGILNRSGAISLSNFQLYTKPPTAFHYCYGRNKRKSDGTVVLRWSNLLPWDTTPTKQYGWYMPGIRELEVALTQHYNTFEDFQGNLYLSAACGKNKTGLGVENTDNCRATGVYFSGGQPKYYESRTGDPGAVSRSSIHRIRAFYKAQ